MRANYRPVERQRQPAAGTAQPRQHAGLAGIVQLADDDCRQMFSDRYFRLFGATDELMPGRRALFADFDIRQSGLCWQTGVLAVIRNDGRPVLSMADGRRTAAEHRNGLCFHFSARRRRAAGAAYATVTAQMLIAAAGLAYFFTRKTALRFDLQMLLS